MSDTEVNPTPIGPPRASLLQRIWARAGEWPTRRAYAALVAGSFVDSTVFPWPIEFPLTAVMLRGRAHVFPAAIAVFVGSLLGYCAVYFVGVFAFDAIASALSGRSGWVDAAAAARADLTAGDETAMMPAVFLAMLTPAPQIVSFAAGAAGLSWPLFVLAAATGRAVRYGSMAILVFIFGERIIAWWNRRPAWFRAGAILAILAVFFAAVVHAVWALASDMTPA